MAKLEIGTILVIAVVGLVLAFGMGWIKLPSSGPAAAPAGGQGSSPGTIVVSATTLYVTPNDAAQPGQAVGYTAQYSMKDAAGANGAWATATSGTTTFSGGNKIDLMFTNASAYHNVCLQNQVVPSAATFSVSVPFNKNATVTEYIFSTLGTSLSNSADGTNQTSVLPGGSISLKDAMYGTALQNTQDMVCVIELTAGVNASTTPSGITLGQGLTSYTPSLSTPVWYSANGANSRVWVFDGIPALKTGNEVDFSIGVNAASGKTIPRSPAGAASLIKTCYTKEWFVDPNTGVCTYAVADSNGLLKSLGQYKFSVYFT